jgi:transcriptional regulator with XRE-family HTH domain
MNEIKSELAKWVREAREFGDLTQDQLGEILGRTKSNISSMEKARHEPSYTQLLQIAKATGFPKPFPGMTEPVALANIISEGSVWPFKSISYEQYLLLSASDKREIESILGIKAEKKAPRKKVKAETS